MSKASKIKGLLLSNGKTQIELAKYMNISEQAIRNKFSRDSFSADDLIKISEFINCKLSMFNDDSSITFTNDDVNLIKTNKRKSKPIIKKNK